MFIVLIDLFLTRIFSIVILFLWCGWLTLWIFGHPHYVTLILIVYLFIDWNNLNTISHGVLVLGSTTSKENVATESSIRGGFPQKESVLQHAFNDDEPFNLYPFWFQQQLYTLRVGLIKIEKKRGVFFSHIYARRVLYASRVSKSESVRIKKRTDEFLQISLPHQKNFVGILWQKQIKLIE